MDRRTYTFVVASAAFLFFYLSLRALVAPPQPQVENPPPAEQTVEATEEKSNDPTSPAPTSEEMLGDAEAGEDAAIPSTRGAAKWFTVGSMDPESKHHLLITFSNRGGAIERIEVTERNEDGRFAFRRVDTKTGYLGYFAAQPTTTVDGVLVNVVAPGTPAAEAVAKTGEKGLQVGDVILAIGTNPVASDADIRAALENTEPGDQVTIEVARGETATAANPLLFEATLTEHPLDLIRLAEDGGDSQIQGNLSRLSCLTTLAQVGRKGISVGQRFLKSLGKPENQIWTGNLETGGDGTQTMRFETTIGSQAMEPLGGAPVRMVRTFTIRPESYLVDMDVEVMNLGDQSQDLALRLEGPNGVTAEGWWYSTKISPNYFDPTAARDIAFKTGDEHQLLGGVGILKQVRKTPENPESSVFASDGGEDQPDLRYIGIDAQYFAVAYRPRGENQSLESVARASAVIVADADKIERHKERAVNTSFYLSGKVSQVAPGQSIKQSLTMFAGPKEPDLLAEHRLDQFIYYGWFSYFSSPLAGLLHILQGIVGNYAVAIVLLTVIVRGSMFPLSRNAAINAQRMQELAPEMKKIAEKYKDDMEGRLKAQQALQKRVGFNPLAGCLPMFLQLPIFMGLYRALSVDIDLRQKPLWDPNGWASNLAAPDQFLFWADWMPDFVAGRGTGWLGPYLNILPLFVVVLFITQQKLFMPPATDEQTAMTQKVMTIMTLFMGLFFFKVPAGLCIYFIASSTWGIAERLFVKKTLPSGKHFNLDEDADVIDAVSSQKKGSGKKSLTERLLDQVNQKPPEKPVERPGKRKRPPNQKKKR